MERFDNFAEERIITQVFNDPGGFDEANLDYTHFANPAHQSIWRTIAFLRKKGVDPDPILVGDELRKRGLLDSVGGYAGLSKYSDPTVTGNISYYANTIKDYWQQRQLLDLTSLIDKGVSSADTIRAIRKKLDSIEVSVARSLPNLKDLIEEEKVLIKRDYESEDPAPNGLLTGLGIEEVVPGGIPRDKVTTLFGESGNFKTTLKNAIVRGIVRNNKGAVLDISLEDSNELTTQRYIADETGIGYGRIATRDINDKELDLLQKSTYRGSERILLGDEVPPDIDEIIRQARYYSRTKDVVCCVVDYVQLLEGKNQKDILDDVIRKCQLSARRDRISYILVSQVKQDVDYRAQNKQSTRPRITDMIGSSSLRFGSKLSIGVYRPFNYDPEASNKNGPYYRLVHEHPEGREIYPMVLELWVVKNVLGEPNVCIPTIVNPATGTMVPMPEELKSLLR